MKIEMIAIDELAPHPKNMHVHSEEQIERLVKIIEYQGFRTPIIAEKGTDLIVCGHGRLLAAKKLGLKKVPVIYQEFKDQDQLYAHMVADNAIGKDTWATLDLSAINLELAELGPEFDLEMLGLKDFKLDLAEEVPFPEMPTGDKGPICQITFTITQDQKEEIEKALALASTKGSYLEDINSNKNGNAIARICETYLTYDRR